MVEALFVFASAFVGGYLGASIYLWVHGDLMGRVRALEQQIDELRVVAQVESMERLVRDQMKE